MMHMQIEHFMQAKRCIENALKYDPTSKRLLERQQKIVSKMAELGQAAIAATEEGKTFGPAWCNRGTAHAS